MTEKDTDTDLRALADRFIALANEQCNDHSKADIGLAMLYASARFHAFLVSAIATDLEVFQQDRETAKRYFLGQYERMLEDNLDDYEGKYIESLKYAAYLKSGNKPQ